MTEVHLMLYLIVGEDEKMRQLFVVSDIHGMYQSFLEVLKYWDFESTLVILGDLIDRGPQSIEVVQHVMNLQQQYTDQVICLKGNHEQAFLDFLLLPEYEWSYYHRIGGNETLNSMLKQMPDEVLELSIVGQVHAIKKQFHEEIDFISKRESYCTVGQVLFTHAGFASQFDSLEHSTAHDFLWIRHHYQFENHTPYVNVFGHTPVRKIHESDDIWISEDRKYIGIDGGCVFDGQLNAIEITTEGKILWEFVWDGKRDECRKISKIY